MDNSDSILNDVSITRKVTDDKHIPAKVPQNSRKGEFLNSGKNSKDWRKKKNPRRKNFHEKRHSGGIMIRMRNAAGLKATHTADSLG